MSPRDTVASHILAAYGELGFRLAAAMIPDAEAAERSVLEAAAACDDPADWLGFLSRVRASATLWIDTHRDDAPGAPAADFDAPRPTALDCSVLPVDALSAREATAKLDDHSRRLVFDVLLGREPTGNRAELEARLAQVLMRLRDEIREANFPAAEDIP